MSRRSLIEYTVGILVLLFVGSLLAGSVLGQPMGVSYVETGSMSPTLEPGDGFIAVPTGVDGSISRGDIIVFRAEQLHGGGLTTHRVVGETDQGYITRGDANPVPDQDGSEPPVKRGQIVGKALMINDQVVVIPALGTVVEGTRSVLTVGQRHLAGLVGTRSLLGVEGLGYLLFALTVLWYGIGTVRAGSTNRTGREYSRVDGLNTRLILGGLTTILVVSATVAMVVPAGAQEYSIVSADFDSDRPTVIPRGESSTVPHRIQNSGVLPLVTYLEPASEGIEVHPRERTIPPRTVANATVTLQAPPATGYYRRFLVEHRYIAILPPAVIGSLYEIHPWLPIIAIDAVIGLPFYLLGVAVVGTGRIRKRTRTRELSVIARIKRLVKTLY